MNIQEEKIRVHKADRVLIMLEKLEAKIKVAEDYLKANSNVFDFTKEYRNSLDMYCKIKIRLENYYKNI